MPPRVVLSTAARDALLAAARRAAPREAIGLLGGAAGTAGAPADQFHVVSFLTMANAAAGEDSFAVPAAAFAAAAAALRARGEILLGFAHSHPRGSAMPSAQDRRELWRDCLHVIVAGGADEPATWSAFRLTRGGVEPLPLEIG